jgi:hypothetical protein
VPASQLLTLPLAWYAKAISRCHRGTGKAHMSKNSEFIRIVGDDPTSHEQIKSVFIRMSAIETIVDGIRCVTITTSNATYVLPSTNPARHARELIKTIAAQTGFEECTETVFFHTVEDRHG